MTDRTSLPDHFLRDDAGSPLGPGMPSGRPLRADGQSHYEAWLSLERLDPCAYCATPGPSGTVDHVEPRSRSTRGLGGAHAWLNTVGACVGCNGAKRDSGLLAFLHRRARSRPAGHRPQRRAVGRRRGTVGVA